MGTDAHDGSSEPALYVLADAGPSATNWAGNRAESTADHAEAASEDWGDRALCMQADPDLWFPEPGEDTRPAKLICGWCPVRSACLAWAMDTNEPYGIWGGLTPDERRRARRSAAAELDGEAA